MVIQNRPNSFNPLNRGILILTKTTEKNNMKTFGSFNPLNRGILILTCEHRAL